MFRLDSRVKDFFDRGTESRRSGEGEGLDQSKDQTSMVHRGSCMLKTEESGTGHSGYPHIDTVCGETKRLRTG